MGPLSKSLLLFTLNWLDGQLTLLWIRMNVATEGNAVMASLLEYGDVPFLSIKLAVGAVAAYVLYRFANVSLARRGMTAVLSIYVVLMFVHALTGCVAFGLLTPML
jgi:hypothetical protein